MFAFRAGPILGEARLFSGTQQFAALVELRQFSANMYSCCASRDDQRRLPSAGADHELEARRCPGAIVDERDRAVGVLARRDLALPLAEVEDGRAARAC